MSCAEKKALTGNYHENTVLRRMMPAWSALDVHSFLQLLRYTVHLLQSPNAVFHTALPSRQGSSLKLPHRVFNLTLFVCSCKSVGKLDRILTRLFTSISALRNPINHYSAILGTGSLTSMGVACPASPMILTLEGMASTSCCETSMLRMSQLSSLTPFIASLL